MKAITIRPKWYLLSPEAIKSIDQFTAVESLIFYKDNSFIFDEKILLTLPKVVKHFSDVLDLSDYKWLQAYFDKNVFHQNNDNTVIYHWPESLCMKIVCELLLENKYSFREDGVGENTIPKLPDPDHLDCGDLDIFYTRYLQTRVDQYVKIVTSMNS